MARAVLKVARSKYVIIPAAVTCLVWWYFSDSNHATSTFKIEERLNRIEELVREVPSADGDDGKCLLQKYDLYDPSILQYVNEPPYRLKCGGTQPYFTYMDWRGIIHLNETEIKKEEYRSIECTYEAVIRRPENEFEVDYGPPKRITSSQTSIDEDTVRVVCQLFGIEIYVTVHSSIRGLPAEKLSQNQKILQERPSVLIFVIDSLSRGQFLRALPKTYKLLIDMGMVVLEGLNKVGDNTFRNMLPLLTGMRYDEDMLHMNHIPQRKFHSNVDKIVKFDDDPIIWKYFSEQGFVTMYGEEYLTPTFNFEEASRSFEGFLKEPVDYYFRPYYVALVDNSWSLFSVLNFRRRYCIGNEPSYRYLLNYTEEFLVKMFDNDIKYFALPFLVEHSHEYLNDIKNLDDDIYATFSRMFYGGYLNNAIVMVMGDHGHRFSGIRSTPIGRLEERMPFFGIALPEGLQKIYPNLKLGLLSNQNVLLSWFDIHSTLLDILHNDFQTTSNRRRQSVEIGRSVFRPVPMHRKCVDIGIPQVYCTCGVEKSIDIKSTIVINATVTLVKYINDLLAKAAYHKSTKRCARLTLLKIHSASLMASWRDLDEGQKPVNVRILFSTVPGQAKLEGAVGYSEDSNEMTVVGDINRVNKYGDQSACVIGSMLKLYCYCS